MRSILAAVAVAAVFGLSGCQKIAARDLIREGNVHYKDGRFAEAIDAYNKAAEIEPDGVTLYWNRACAAESLALRSKGDTERAEERKRWTDQALADFKKWIDRLEQPTEEDTKSYNDHRLALLDADERCDDLLAHWLEKHNGNPSEEGLYSVIARLYDRCGKTKEADEWYLKRTKDFPESVRAFHALAIRKFDPLWPDPDSGMQYNTNLTEEERLRAANEVIGLLDKATLIDPKFRDAYTWRAMAYTQRQFARRYSDDVENNTLQENLNRILAREDSMLAWKQQKAVCDIEELPSCGDKVPDGQCCVLENPPLTPEEQQEDAETKKAIEQEMKELAEAPEEPQKKRKKGRRR